MYYSEQIGLPKTDSSRWRLRTDDIGSEWWEYINEEDKDKDPQTTFAQHLLERPEFPSPEPEVIKSPLEAAKKGGDFFSLLMDPCGLFPCQYKGPMFMTIGWVISLYYTKTEIPKPFKIEMIRYIVNSAHPVDGGWGLHSIDKSTCFGTTMNYITLRLLGMKPDHPVCVKARKTLHRLGGAAGNPLWGKVWLSVLNVYSYDGVNPAPPELWMLPYWVPIHPGRWWVHVRAIYAPFGYLIMNRVQCELDPLLQAIRNEIYLPLQLPYEKIDFFKHRNNVCGIDLHYPHSKLLNFLNGILNVWEHHRPNWVKKIAGNTIYDIILKELKNTEYLSIAPLSYGLNLIIVHLEEGPDSETFKRMADRRYEVLFHGAQGMTVMGTNGTQTWDGAFTIQYFFQAGLADDPRYQPFIKKAYKYLVRNQITTEVVEGSFRDSRVGSWGFSTKDQGYTVSDCTAEAVKAILMVQHHPDYADVKDEILKERLYQAIDVLLAIQNRGSYEFGSFAAYESIRGSQYLEWLNPAEVFNNIMIEYPYVECTDSSVLGLTYFTKYHPEYKSDQIKFAIDNAIAYIRKSQLIDGSWYGSWGICYTNATMFALEALNSIGLTYANDDTVKRGCDFLISKQCADGGWSESMKSCETQTYVNSGKSLVVQTAWAAIGLILAKYPHREPIKKAIDLIMERQLPTGEWKTEEVVGVFNHSCAIEYPSYQFIYPIKALGLYAKMVNEVESQSP